jgi:hypothetical protein
MRITAAAVLVALAAWPSSASADGATDACIESHANGQILRKQGHLVAARDRFIACAEEACPAMVRSECASFAADVEPAIPSVVFAASDENGGDALGATVSIDGQDARALDGRAVDVDPGPHDFQFRAAGRETKTVSLVLREADHLRRVGVVLPSTEQPKSGLLNVHPMVYVFGGLGAAATASFIVFALKGRGEENGMNGCRPLCQQPDVDAMRRDYLIGDISLAVALASFSVGTYFFLHPPESEPPATRTAKPRLDWAPAVGPGVAVMTARGAF